MQLILLEDSINEVPSKKKNMRLIIRMVTLQVTGNNIKYLTERTGNIEFPQRCAVVNIGDAILTTFNLVNCISIGGIFNDGVFLTHESPSDIIEHKRKLREIASWLKQSNRTLTKVVLFRINQTTSDQYNISGKLMTTEDVITELINFCQSLWSKKPEIKTYTCDITTFKCGNVSFGKHNVNVSMKRMRYHESKESTDTEVRNNEVKYLTSNKPEKCTAKWNDKHTRLKCLFCKGVSGSLLIITHDFNCRYKDTIPIVSAIDGGKRCSNKKTISLEMLTVKELREKAVKNKISLTGLTKKVDIVAKIRSASVVKIK